ERSQLLETLGEMIVSMIDDGSFEDVPESVKQAYARIKAVQQRLREDDGRAHDNAYGAPRGYEPEAASDYGDDPPDDAGGESGESLDGAAAARAGGDDGDEAAGDPGGSERAGRRATHR